MYVNEPASGVIRQVHSVTGSTTTIAGQKDKLGSKPGLLNTNLLGYVYPIFYLSGNLYSADVFNALINKVEIASGQLSIVAGVFGERKLLDGTSAVARIIPAWGLSGTGNDLFFTESVSGTIRKLNLVDNSLSTIIGKANRIEVANLDTGFEPSTQLNRTASILVYNNKYYYTDYFTSGIHVYDKATKQVSLFAGSNSEAGSADGTLLTARFFRPQAIVKLGTDFFVADTFNHTIRKIDSAGNVTTIAGTAGLSGSTEGAGASALFNLPWELLVVGSDLYVADSGNHKIRRITNAQTTPIVSTFAGSGVAGANNANGILATFNTPSHISTDGTNFYIADTRASTFTPGYGEQAYLSPPLRNRL